MKQRILSHTSFIIVLTVLLTFGAACGVMYNKVNSNMKDGVRNEAEYIKSGIEAFGNEDFTDKIENMTTSRITLTDKDGNVLLDNEADPAEMKNHSNRPEFIQAMKEGSGESVRYSETLSKQTYYYAVRLSDGKVLRIARTTDSVFHTLMSSFTLLGLLMVCIILVEFILVQKQTDKMIKPINNLDLEHPLKNVCYEELRPLLVRVDEQNRQLSKQMEELKSAQAMRQEFSANVSHELKTPLMSISGYAELMMNGMVPAEKVTDFSGRIYHEATRLSSLVADIIQLSRLDEGESSMAFERVDLYEMLYNIADNAVRYTPDGGQVHISAGKKKGRTFYRVEDNGIGIPKAEQGRIFERFYRVDKSHSRETGGTGLGLSIVKHGALIHHAKVTVDSDLGKGTAMEILFSQDK